MKEFNGFSNANVLALAIHLRNNRRPWELLQAEAKAFKNGTRELFWCANSLREALKQANLVPPAREARLVLNDLQELIRDEAQEIF